MIACNIFRASNLNSGMTRALLFSIWDICSAVKLGKIKCLIGGRITLFLDFFFFFGGGGLLRIM